MGTEDKKPSLAEVLGGLVGGDSSSGTDVILDLSSNNEHLPMRTEIRVPERFTVLQVVADVQAERGFPKTAAIIRSFCGWQYQHLVSKGRKGRAEAFDALGRQLALENEALMRMPDKKKGLGSRLLGR